MADVCQTIKDSLEPALKIGGTVADAAKKACETSLAAVAKGTCDANICSAATVQVVTIYIFFPNLIFVFRTLGSWCSWSAW